MKLKDVIAAAIADHRERLVERERAASQEASRHAAMAEAILRAAKRELPRRIQRAVDAGKAQVVAACTDDEKLLQQLKLKFEPWLLEEGVGFHWGGGSDGGPMLHELYVHLTADQ